MPVYRYLAKDSAGKTEKGEMYGETRGQVLSLLKRQKLFPVSVSELAEAERRSRYQYFLSPKVKKKHIAIFTRQFASMLNAGVPLPVILDVLIRQERNSTFRKILEEINEDIMKGRTISASMSRFDVFPPLLVSMVEVGEANGRLEVSFERTALNLEKEIKLASKIKGAMIYPSVLLIVTMLVSVLLTVFVLPVFTDMFSQMNTELPALTQILLGISGFLRGYWYIPVITLILVVLILFKLMKEPDFKRQIDRMVMHIPIIGRLANIVFMARFCRTFSSLVEGGVPVVPSLEIVKNVMPNQYVKSSLDDIIAQVQSGTTISQAASEHRIFTPLVISMIRIGEESGRMGEVMTKTAELYEDDSDAQLQRAAALVEPMITLLMALGVGFIVLSIVQPMFGMYKLLGK